ncbi:MAG: hypothetical protein ACRDSH_06110 [Pseudonocardiaceae bacterium]
MAQTDSGPGADQGGALSPRSPDLLTLVAGLVALGLAGTTLLGGIAWLPDVDGRWVLAALALVIGLLLVIGSLRTPRR